MMMLCINSQPDTSLGTKVKTILLSYGVCMCTFHVAFSICSSLYIYKILDSSEISSYTSVVFRQKDGSLKKIWNNVREVG